MTPKSSLTACSLVVTLALWGPSAAADVTKAQCIDANTHGQSLRQDHKLAEARAQFQACSDAGCPGIVASDCTKRLDEIETAQPTMVFDVKDGSGHDLAVVKVSVDNTLLTNTIDGSPVRLEPGSHVFTFEIAGQAPVTQTFVVKEGEKERHEKIVIGTSPAPSLSTTPTPAASTSAPTEQRTSSMWTDWTTTRTIGAVAGGVGVVGIAAGAVFGLIATSTWNNAQNECGTPANCPKHAQALSDHDSAVTDATISTIGFVAGGALLAGGVVTFLLGGHSATQEAPQAQQTGLTLAPAIGPGSSGFSLKGRF